MNPPAIRHFGQRCSRKLLDELIHECATGVHLTSGAEKLLRYYASCGEGFRPAKKTVYAETGIHPSTLYRYKKELEDMAIIREGEYGRAICLDWDRIRLYSTLDPSMTSRGRKNVTVSPEVRFTKPQKMGSIGEKYRPRAEGRELTPAQEHFYKRLDEMTEDEWNSIQRDMGEDIPEPFEDFGPEPYIDWLERDYDPSQELPVSPEEARWQREMNKQLPF